MLVISRKKDERFKVGDDIEIVIVKIENGKVLIGIEAPKDMLILRNELKEQAQ